MTTIPEQSTFNLADALEALSESELRALVTVGAEMDDGKPGLTRVFAELAAQAGWLQRRRAAAMIPFQKDLLEGRVEAWWGEPSGNPNDDNSLS